MSTFFGLWCQHLLVRKYNSSSPAIAGNYMGHAHQSIARIRGSYEPKIRAANQITMFRWNLMVWRLMPIAPIPYLKMCCDLGCLAFSCSQVPVASGYLWILEQYTLSKQMKQSPRAVEGLLIKPSAYLRPCGITSRFLFRGSGCQGHWLLFSSHQLI